MEKEPVEIKIESMNHKGYGVGMYEGKEAWVLNALPGETVTATLRRKKGIYIGNTVQIIVTSPHRVEPRDAHYMSSSPFQIMTLEEENRIKEGFLSDLWPERDAISIVTPSADDSWNYRNKVEFSFYGDDEDITHLSYFMRGSSFGKIPLEKGCSLLPSKVNEVAYSILAYINNNSLRARQLKSLILRYSWYEDAVVASLYVKDESLEFSKDSIETLLTNGLKGIRIVYSSHKSPASIISAPRIVVGDTDLIEEISGIKLQYSIDSFFQVNPPVFQLAMNDIISYIQAIPNIASLNLIDMYAGVGTIGLILSKYVARVTGVELYNEADVYAKKNTALNSITDYSMVVASSERALDYITVKDILVVDPPRSGLHDDVIKRILDVKPPYIIYLSCNPVSQCADVEALLDQYDITIHSGYNFYPHTPHLESLMCLKRK